MFLTQPPPPRRHPGSPWRCWGDGRPPQVLGPPGVIPPILLPSTVPGTRQKLCKLLDPPTDRLARPSSFPSPGRSAPQARLCPGPPLSQAATFPGVQLATGSMAETARREPLPPGPARAGISAPGVPPGEGPGLGAGRSHRHTWAQLGRPGEALPRHWPAACPPPAPPFRRPWAPGRPDPRPCRWCATQAAWERAGIPPQSAL